MCMPRRLQIQERLTLQIKDCLQRVLNPLGVMVVIEAQHMCMQMRGIEKQPFDNHHLRFYGSFQRVENSRRVHFVD